ncbi:carbohydrate ABC transporter permease [Sediminispirochaeta smaragdinae]|jgi:raffinose/stachyose/melibiose transport system permease protein|uniref:Binding-protein-dependent transport systems inner membrane component n=1 Tax=Sediminispirochaeta smaragdinae (strain DSM 11293 / JCM 15392 / SEBR 4228) TaxID=573413 RepID=E1R4A3_SEDSS|nr:carbohydrate ABC transporter permease [Sediminispirochaeta smaragdinae]ADK80525.1 binding-protein-dependent transport systems inner membrane component [Sediminispirochaeta smaragdinae DSM 11293]
MPKLNRDISAGWRLFAYVFLIFFTLITLMPLLWMLYSSFKLQGEIMMYPLSLPKEPTFKNYRDAWSIGHMGIAAINSILYTGIGTFFTVLFSLAAGFALTKFNYASAKWYYAAFTLGLLITVNSVIAPLFIMETRMGLYDTRIGVILPYIAFGLPMAVLLATSYIRGIPDSLIEAAVIDGASYIQIFLKVIIIVSTPVMATITVLTFLRNWNEFILVFILTSGEHMRSLPVSINAFAGRLNVNYGMQFAALVIGTIPMILFYIGAHNMVIKGFGEGALKE